MWSGGEKWSEVAQSCPTLCDPMDCSLPGSSVHGILQARILEWVSMPSFRESSWPRDRTRVSHIVDRCFTVWATRRNRPNCLNFSLSDTNWDDFPFFPLFQFYIIVSFCFYNQISIIMKSQYVLLFNDFKLFLV